MKVRDVFQTITKGADVVRETDPIPEVIRKVAQDFATQSVFVVDDGEKLVGIINVRDLLRIAGAKFLNRETLTVIPYLTAQKASDIMQPPYSVSPDDEIDEGLRLAVQHDLRDVPVVEGDKVVGDLNCFEILLNIKYE
ncbi:MAG: CBS domain-containing protein [Nitrospinota bacterium]|jgi:CBS domain-containing protein|nr:CBS domain-containing protein [Nitrospinota bacterium]MDP6484462.1 CBS domain-containing protein [Nitrospinota bacterium]MDP6618945.1 CBS domain-containing protein [Nitrospinota bacterium]MDP7384516.1 CBS domain-containing protein [Nitrospinota bacterium]HJM43630.1 CBS domain-containing protein [Nitrospinota bacterium]